MIGTTFVVLAIVLLAVPALCLAWPLFRQAAPTDRAAFDLAVYRDQLAEIDRDQARGLIAADQAEAARIEVRRRIVRAVPASSEPLPNVPAAKPLRRFGLGALAIGLPLLAGFTYLSLGRPDLPSTLVAAGAQRTAPASNPALLASVAELEAALGRNPQDVAVLVRLGRARAALGQMDQAIAALRQARGLAPDDPRIQVELADVLTTAEGGVVTPEARDLFEASTKNTGEGQQQDPRAAYFLGVADAQAGDLISAIDRWRRLLATAPASAPWRQDLIESIEVAASQAGVAPNLPASPEPGTDFVPGEADVQAMAEMSPEERTSRIRGMVEGLDKRLQEDGSDTQAWLRLGRARLVLGERDKAIEAFERAAAQQPGDPEILMALGEASIAETHEPTGLPLVNDRAREVFRQMSVAAPDDPRPLWFLGLAYAQAGNRDEAVRQWKAMLTHMPADSPDRASIEELVRQLGG